MKLVHATVQDFNMFPVQLADAMRRLHEKQAVRLRQETENACSAVQCIDM